MCVIWLREREYLSCLLGAVTVCPFSAMSTQPEAALCHLANNDLWQVLDAGLQTLGIHVPASMSM
eukprot:m.1456318 g.1456318  ORF g.1456318 m.1456318 type:complete len:65 (+) comp25121_c0_seq10:194-388(+)